MVRAPQAPALAPNGRLLCYVLAPLSRIGDHLDTELWLVGRRCRHRRITPGDRRHRDRIPATLVGQLGNGVLLVRPRRPRYPQLHGLTLADGTMTMLSSWRGGVLDHLPLSDPNLVALLAEDEPTEQDAGGARDRDNAGIVVGEREPRPRMRLLDLRTGQVTTPRSAR